MPQGGELESQEMHTGFWGRGETAPSQHPGLLLTELHTKQPSLPEAGLKALGVETRNKSVLSKTRQTRSKGTETKHTFSRPDSLKTRTRGSRRETGGREADGDTGPTGRLKGHEGRQN